MIALLLLVGGVVFFIFLWRDTGAQIRPGACRGCNVLLITIDTLRLDRVGAFGSHRGLTPTMDRLASRGLTLTRAYASAPLTLPSHTSILTAVSPPVHGVRANGLFRLGPQLPTIATVLKRAGYRTGAFVGAFVLDARFGLGRGFDVYDDKYGEKHEDDLTEGAERKAEEVITPALAWIAARPSTSSGRADDSSGRADDSSRRADDSSERADDSSRRADDSSRRAGSDTARPERVEGRAPWFAWVHLYDPHEPYDAPEPWRSQHEPYDAEVAYTDAMIGRLLDDLRASGQLDRTLVIVCGDHGESLGEHGERTRRLYRRRISIVSSWASVPSVSRGPSIATARDESRTVRS